LESYIFENEIIPFEHGIRGCLDHNFVGEEIMRQYCNKIRNLKVKDLLDGRGTARSYEGFSAATSIIIPEQKFFVLVRACMVRGRDLQKLMLKNRRVMGLWKFSTELSNLANLLGGPYKEICCLKSLTM
jgi:hypothetical protein